MAGKENMNGKQSASTDLLTMLKNDYRISNTDSLFFKYKEKELEEKFEKYKTDGKNATEYNRLCELYESASNGGLAEYLNYLQYVTGLFGGKGFKDYIRSGKTVLSGSDLIYKNEDVLKDFKERWTRRLLAFGFSEVFGDKDITASQISKAFGNLTINPGKPGDALDLELIREVAEEMHKEVREACIHKSINSDFENFADSKKIDRDLLDLCSDYGFLRVGLSDAGTGKPDHAGKTETCANILQEIYDIEDIFKRQEYETVFIPIDIDPLTGVSFCIVGKESFREHYNTLGGDDKAAYGKCPFPCIPAVLRFTDVAFGCMFSTDQYEIQRPFITAESDAVFNSYDSSSGGRSVLLKEYCESIYSDYRQAVMDARRLLSEIDSCDQKVESLLKLDFYKQLFIEAPHTPAAQAAKAGFENEFDAIKRK